MAGHDGKKQARNANVARRCGMVVGGVASGFVLFVVSNLVFALGLSAKVPVALAAWTPTGVSLIFGASTLLHLEDG